MKHMEMKEMLCISLYGELNIDEQRLLQTHLDGCNECRTEMMELRQVHAALNECVVSVSDRFIAEARAELHSSLVRSSLHQSIADVLTDFLAHAFAPRYSIAFGAITMAAIGLFIGYVIFSPSGERVTPTTSGEAVTEASALAQDAQRTNTHSEETVSASHTTRSVDNAHSNTFVPMQSRGEIRASNFRIIHADAQTGDIEIVYDAFSLVRVNGNVHDAHIKKLLLLTLKDDDNPGVRLRAVGMMTAQDEKTKGIDPELKDALITSLQRDANPAMRLAVLNVLRLHIQEKDIQQVMADVVTRDKNSGVRVAAINVLAEARLDGCGLDRNILAALKQKLQFDKNIFIRKQTLNLIQEGTQL